MWCNIQRRNAVEAWQVQRVIERQSGMRIDHGAGVGVCIGLRIGSVR